MCYYLCSSPVKKPSLLKTHQFEGDPFDSGSEGSEGLGPCVSSLSSLIGTVAETSEEKYRLLDQRDRIMRQGMVGAPQQRSRDLAKVMVRSLWELGGGSNPCPWGSTVIESLGPPMPCI